MKKPIDVDKETFYSVMHDIHHQCWHLANKGIRMLWDFYNFNYSYKQRFGEYLLYKKGDELPNGYKNVKSDILNECKDEIPALAGHCKDAMIRMVEQKWKYDLKDILNGNKSIPNFKRCLPIELHNKQFMDNNKNYRIFMNDKKYTVILTLVNRDYAKSIGLSKGSFHLELLAKDEYQRLVLDRIINREYKLSMSKMQFDKNKKKWFLLLCYSYESKIKQLDKNKVLGIDLGIKNPVVCAISDNINFTRKVGNSEEISHFENQMKDRKKRLQNSCVWAGNGSIGHGRNTRTKRLNKIRNKISNYKSTKNHNWSREIVNMAVKNNCGIIQMEDLKGISVNYNFLKTWNYYDLQEKITYKAREVGIEVIKINPKYTSARCFKCGIVHLGNKEKWRPNQETFHCQSCGHKVNADVNASRNIAVKDIDKIIESQVKLQQKVNTHLMKYSID